MTPTSLYLASTRQDYRLAADTVYPPEMFTDIHKFSVAANDFNYKGSGTVNGHLGWSQELKSSRLSEYQSDLRVITFTGQSTGWFGAPIATSDQTLKTASPAKLTVMREGKDADGTAALQVISTLPSATRPDNIGKVGEQIYGVRFFANKAYVVTFRRTDPLYVLDLTNASDPKVAGALEVPGFSDYLLPVGDSLLFGIGKDANAQGRATGVKVALYDVSNPALPVEVSKKVYGNSGSASGIDYSSHGLNLLQKGNITRLTLPMVLNQTDPTISASSNLSKGLYRFEINSTAKTLVEKTPVGQQVFDKNDINSYVFYNLNNDRALQVNDSVYYLRPDGLKVFAW
jgi:Beta propeller domain